MASDMAKRAADRILRGYREGTITADGDFADIIDAEFLPSMQAQSARVEELAAICDSKNTELDRLDRERRLEHERAIKLESERDALAAQVEELKRDAERYIELRDGDCPLAVADICLIQNRGALVGGKLDVELDAWIAARAAEAAAIQEPSRDE